MFVLDTDTLTHLLRGNERVIQKRRQATDEVAITVITRIEVLQGRFASALKAEDGKKLLLAQQRLEETENDLAKFVTLRVGVGASAEFDRLRQNRKFRKIGRADLLIAAIALANQATLVTCNREDFRKAPGLRIENWTE
jgi:tRNA(fMet)-specific endonuclease VapC